MAGLSNDAGGRGLRLGPPRGALVAGRDGRDGQDGQEAETAETAEMAEAAETAGWSRRNLPSDFFPRRSSWG